MTHPMLEKVSEAIISALEAQEHVVDYDDDDDAHLHSGPYPTDFLAIARAAVQALLEPDEGMVEIGMDYDEREIEIATGTPPTPAQCVAGQFRAMLVSMLED